MPGAIQRTPPPPVLQALIIRRDLNLKCREALECASRAALAFIVTRVPHGGAWSFTAAETEWLYGKQTQVCLRVYNEAALLKVADDARSAGVGVHVIVRERTLQRSTAPVTLCCAIGPAPTDQIAEITGQLTVW